MSTIKKLMMTAAGGEFLAIEDVFSTYLYKGNDANPRTITNGIDLAGEGGLVWTKARGTWLSYDLSHVLSIGRGSGNASWLSSNTSSAGLNTTDAPLFLSDGYQITANNYLNASATTVGYVSWTFRKAPRFFDVVTFTTTYNVNPNVISYNLEADLGCAIFKQLNSTGQGINWIVYHRSLGTGKYLRLNETASTITDAQSFVAVDNENSTISFGYPMSNVNDRLVSGGTETTNWVGYFFAHDPLGPSGDGSDGLIACGSFVTNYSGAFSVNLGWEPQFILLKRTDSSGSWTMFDSMRGLAVTQNSILVADQSNAEQSLQYLIPDATGFSSNPGYFGAGQTYIYIAIRRGPMREPTSGTEVFAIDTESGTSPSPPAYTSGFPVDMGIYKTTTGSSSLITSRLTQDTAMNANTAAAEFSSPNMDFDFMDGWFNGSTVTPTRYSWMFRRAPGFFDVVAYKGTSGTATKPHNLGVVPEMMIFKNRNDTDPWAVYHSATGNTGYTPLNLTSGFLPSSLAFNNTSPTASVFTVGSTLNWSSSFNYIAYLFATLPGVSKVGSYTGNGSSQTINCGFTGGARFVLIKRTDAGGDWYVWDTARGIVSGNDPHLSLNTTAAEVTSDDTIDPDSSGFIVNQVAATNVNVSSASYIYLAIA
jgi:hypothetical protein